MTTRPENEAALPTAASRANACNNPLVQRLFAQDARRFACRAQTPLEFGQWPAPRHGLRLPQLAFRSGRTHPDGRTGLGSAVAELQRIYAAAGAPNRYQHAFGNGGHRFYKNLMWPFVQQMRKESNGVPEP